VTGSRHTRRDFLRLASLTTAGAVLAACSGEPEVVEKIVKETVIVEKEVEKIITATPAAEAEAEATAEPAEEPTAEPTEPAGTMLKFSEAPMLAERVAAGELPPVEERLPEDPLVVEPLEAVGQYGGTLRAGGVGSTLFPGDGAVVGTGRQDWLRMGHDLNDALPNLLSAYEISEDLTTITCHLRPGMRWSDGEPVTLDDLMFRYEDVWQNSEITPLIHERHRPGGTLMELIRVDDQTFQFKFAVPHPNYVMHCMAHQVGWGEDNFLPAHYLKQFHIKYNDKAGELAKAAGFDFWYQLFAQKSALGQNPERPSIRAYACVADNPQFATWERNPYFWMVDTAGNQLPYVDRVEAFKMADLSILDAKAISGQFDFAGFDTNIQNYATYTDAAEQGGFRVILWQSGKGAEVVYNVNMTYGDEEMRAVFSDVRFRQALSLAINREDINQVVYYGNAFSRQMTVIPTSKFFRPEFETAQAAYDVDKANALLDEMGLEWNADRTRRLWPTSRTEMVISWDLYESETPKRPITELITEYWRAIGVDIQWKSITRALLSQKVLANEEPMSLWHGDATTDVLFKSRPKWFVPTGGEENTWGILWGQWYDSQGKVGEEPPEEIKQLYRWFEEFGRSRSVESAQNILSAQAENIWTIGTVGNAPHPILANKKLRNIPEEGYWVWDSLFTYSSWPEQWYLEQ
jgi:peptide/nickel transport system substrate-binding protein